MSVHDAGGHPLMSLTRAYSLFSYVAPVAVRLAPCRDATNRPFEHSPPYSVIDTAGPCGSPQYRLPGPYPTPYYCENDDTTVRTDQVLHQGGALSATVMPPLRRLCTSSQNAEMNTTTENKGPRDVSNTNRTDCYPHTTALYRFSRRTRNSNKRYRWPISPLGEALQRFPRATTYRTTPRIILPDTMPETYVLPSDYTIERSSCLS